MSTNIQDIFEELQSEEANHNPLFEQFSKDYIVRNHLVPLNNIENTEKPCELISQAKEEVLIQSYKFDVDSAGYVMICDGLKSLSQTATEDKNPRVVNILINKRGVLGEIFLNKNPSANPRDLFPPDHKYFKINIVYHQAEMFGSYHTKMIIVDGKQSIIRGCDPSKSSTKGRALIETGALITDTFSQRLREDFRRSWNKYCPFTAQMQILTPTEETVRDNSEKIPIAFISKKANGNIFRYTHHKSPFKVAFLKAIKLSRESIDILTQNINDPEILIALADACNRGVKLNIAISKTANDKREAHLGGTNTQSVLLLAQMIEPTHLGNLDVKWSTKEDGTITKGIEASGIHGKFASFDNQIVITGSSVLDLQSTEYSKEADIIFQDEQKAREFKAHLFEEVFAKGKNFQQHAYDTIVNLIQKAAPDMSLPQSEGTSYSDKSRNLIASVQDELKTKLTPSAYDALMDKINDELRLMGDRISKPVNVKDILYAERKRIVLYALVASAIVFSSIFSAGIALPVIVAAIGVTVIFSSEAKTIQQTYSHAKPAEVTIAAYKKANTQLKSSDTTEVANDSEKRLFK